MVVRTTRHLPGWTPESVPDTAPLSRCPCLSARSTVGQPALWTPTDLPAWAARSPRLDAAPKAGCPTVGTVRGGLRPTAQSGRWRPYFRWDENLLAAPARFTDRVGTVRFHLATAGAAPRRCSTAAKGIVPAPFALMRIIASNAVFGI